ncbi:UDP-glucose dehydrogenase family protein [Bacillus infantis]|uniref:UDP-glucose dehydrogenase family protein n=1 Tax=Bacillus infantis TaxID=324767 RepID=UPI003CF8063D
MNISCIGAGYVGSVTGTAFAALGIRTTIIDINHNRVEAFNNGRSPIFEPGLEELIQSNIGKTLFAATGYEAIADSDVVFIGVGTPSKEDGNVDLSYVEQTAKNIGEHLNPNSFTVVVNKSTVPVGTANLVSSIIEKSSGLKSGEHFAVVSNPEFLREGYAVEDVFFPDRIIIGSENSRASEMMKELYGLIISRKDYDSILSGCNLSEGLFKSSTTYYETDVKSSEMIKYASNAFLAVKISYINEVARLSDALGANALEVAKGMGMDSRIGSKFLEVSSGWSGSCFPKDTAEFLLTSQKANRELSIVKSAVESNVMMHQYCVDKAELSLGSLKGKTIGILGLTFKPNTDDARNTQATYIIEQLLRKGASIKAHDPQGAEMFKSLNVSLAVDYCDSSNEVFEGADGVILLTHWKEYRSLNWVEASNRMRNGYLLDTRNFLRDMNLQEFGISYEGIGIGNAMMPLTRIPELVR